MSISQSTNVKPIKPLVLYVITEWNQETLTSSVKRLQKEVSRGISKRTTDFVYDTSV